MRTIWGPVHNFAIAEIVAITKGVIVTNKAMYSFACLYIPYIQFFSLIRALRLAKQIFIVGRPGDPTNKWMGWFVGRPGDPTNKWMGWLFTLLSTLPFCYP